jgi:hypothetical protein
MDIDNIDYYFDSIDSFYAGMTIKIVKNSPLYILTKFVIFYNNRIR